MRNLSLNTLSLVALSCSLFFLSACQNEEINPSGAESFMQPVADSLQSQDMYTKQGDFNALYRSMVYTHGQIKRERGLSYTTTFTSWPAFHQEFTSVIDVYQDGVKKELGRTLNSRNATVRFGSKPPFDIFSITGEPWVYQHKR